MLLTLVFFQIFRNRQLMLRLPSHDYSLSLWRWRGRNTTVATANASSRPTTHPISASTVEPPSKMNVSNTMILAGIYLASTAANASVDSPLTLLVPYSAMHPNPSSACHVPMSTPTTTISSASITSAGSHSTHIYYGWLSAGFVVFFKSLVSRNSDGQVRIKLMMEFL